MSVSKDGKKGTWKSYLRYKDWKGEIIVKTKRGFSTKKEGQDWEREFLNSKTKSINMQFGAFVELYLKDKKPRIKHNTYLTKKYIINQKILPYFEKRILSEITASDVIQWQNELLSFRDEENKPYSQTYMRTVQNQLSAIFNHACKFYNLNGNPSTKAGKMGKAKAKEMLFWTKKEYFIFIDEVKDKPESYYAFEVLYWCGIRLGELLALTPEDIDVEAKTLKVNKSYQRLERKDYITEPKTEKSNRTIQLPGFLANELEDYIKSLYKIKNDERLFSFTKNYLHREMARGSKKAGVKKIRIHDLRHSHVAHLIELGFSLVAIAERLGHESIEVIYNYAHLYPSKQIEIAFKLQEERE